MEELYLVMTNAGANNNKFYRMVPHGDVFDVYYGRIGASEQHASYPISKWNTKYNEKIRKGYTDQTANHRTPVVTKKVSRSTRALRMLKSPNLCRCCRNMLPEQFVGIIEYLRWKSLRR